MRNILALSLAMSLVGCTSGSSPETLDATSIDEPVIEALDVPVLTGEASGNEALSTFTLQYDDNLNCLYHDEEDNNGEPGTGGRVVIQWPRGTTASLANGVVTVIDAQGTELAKSGEPVTLTGGGSAFLGSDHCNAIGIWIVNN